MEVSACVGVEVYAGTKTGVMVNNGVGEIAEVALAMPAAPASFVANGILNAGLPESKFMETSNRANKSAAMRKPASRNVIILLLVNVRTVNLLVKMNY